MSRIMVTGMLMGILTTSSCCSASSTGELSQDDIRKIQTLEKDIENLRRENKAIQVDAQIWKDKFLKEVDLHYLTMERSHEQEAEILKLRAEIKALKQK